MRRADENRAWAIRQCGFTLVELLVALGLMAAIAAGVAGAFRMGGAVWKRTTNQKTLEQIGLAQRFLRRHLEQAQPPATRDGTRWGGLLGETDRMTFTAPLMIGGDTDGLYRISLLTIQDEITRSLTLNWQLGRSGRAQEPDGLPSEALVKGIRGVEFAYATMDTAEPVWQANWSDKTELPIIRIRVSFPQSDPRRWPDLIVRPLVATDAGCVYDPVSRGCRGR